MDWCLISLPIISALIGWITNVVAVRLLFRPRKPVSLGLITLQGMVPRRQKDLAQKLGNIVVNDLLPPDEILSKLEQIDIEGEVTSLLRDRIDVVLEKFKEKTPMLAMVMNDSFKAKIKDLVIEEIVNELPVWKRTLAMKVVGELDFYQLVEDKVVSLEVAKVERLVLSVAKKELRTIEWLGGVLGFLIGLVQLGIVHYWLCG